MGDTIILPLVDVSFGIGAGSFRAENAKGMGGIGGRLPRVQFLYQEWNDKLVM